MHELVQRTMDLVRINGARWADLATLDRDLLLRRPAPTEWSALECLGHTVDTESAIFAQRVRSVHEGVPMLRGLEPDPDDPAITGDTDPLALARQHGALLVDSLAALAEVTEADLDKRSQHATFGTVSLRQQIAEWAAHDTMHLVQAERAIMQWFIPATGPFRSSFADHDVDPHEDPRPGG